MLGTYNLSPGKTAGGVTAQWLVRRTLPQKILHHSHTGTKVLKTVNKTRFQTTPWDKLAANEKHYSIFLLNL